VLNYLMIEPKVPSNMEDNIGYPFAPLLYATSTLHCLTSPSRAAPGSAPRSVRSRRSSRSPTPGSPGITVTPRPATP
jgi:hypothetical protein